MRRARALFAGLSFAVAFIMAAIPPGARAGDRPLSFTDPEDGQLDMSDFLLEHKGALPVPVVITEPAVGYGLGLGLLFFSGPVSDQPDAEGDRSGSRVPPNVTALGGLYTTNGTWAAAAAHFHTWDNDRYRYLGALVKADAHLDYFGGKLRRTGGAIVANGLRRHAGL
jgi:hypothetical protein